MLVIFFCLQNPSFYQKLFYFNIYKNGLGSYRVFPPQVAPPDDTLAVSRFRGYKTGCQSKRSSLQSHAGSSLRGDEDVLKNQTMQEGPRCLRFQRLSNKYILGEASLSPGLEAIKQTPFSFSVVLARHSAVMRTSSRVRLCGRGLAVSRFRGCQTNTFLGEASLSPGLEAIKQIP